MSKKICTQELPNNQQPILYIRCTEINNEVCNITVLKSSTSCCKYDCLNGISKTGGSTPELNLCLETGFDILLLLAEVED
jgi:hypothetical protein